MLKKKFQIIKNFNCKMKIIKSILDYIHLDPDYNLLTARNAKVIYTIFKALDIHNEGLNGIK